MPIVAFAAAVVVGARTTTARMFVVIVVMDDGHRRFDGGGGAGRRRSAEGEIGVDRPAVADDPVGQLAVDRVVFFLRHLYRIKRCSSARA